MMDINYIIIVGVRPQFIKAASLIDELERNKKFNGRIHLINTGQHYSSKLSKDILEEIGLVPDLTIKHKKNASDLAIIAKSLVEVEQYIKSHLLENTKIIVFGDANPTLVGGLIALKLRIPLIHIEAGARRSAAEQEHYNSKLVDSLAKLKLCVTKRAVDELKKENNGANVILTGDMSRRWMNDLIDFKGKKRGGVKRVLVTLHRPDNMRKDIINAVYRVLCEINSEVVWISHPRVMKLLPTVSETASNISIIPPQSYLKVQHRLAWADVLLTDSGGLAREAHYFKIPILMRRDVGGWPELAKLGALKNVGVNNEVLHAGFDWAFNLKYPKKQLFSERNGIDEGINAIIKLSCNF